MASTRRTSEGASTLFAHLILLTHSLCSLILVPNVRLVHVEWMGDRWTPAARARFFAEAERAAATGTLKGIALDDCVSWDTVSRALCQLYDSIEK